MKKDDSEAVIANNEYASIVELLNVLGNYVDKPNKTMETETKSDEDLLEEMRVIKSWDPRAPYRIMVGNVDCTPLPFKDKKAQQFKIPMDINDFASLFFMGNFIPAKLPLFFYDETSSLITGFITGSKYRCGAFPLENTLREHKRSKKRDKNDKTNQCVVGELKRTKIADSLVTETFKICLQETETFEIVTLHSIFIDPDPKPFFFKVEPTKKGVIPFIFHSVVKSHEMPPKNGNSNDRKATFFPVVNEISTTTTSPLFYDKGVVTNIKERHHQSVHVTPSDICDTFQIFEGEDDRKSIIVDDDARLCNIDYLNVSTSALDSPEFNYIFTTIERMLASNYYHEMQKLYQNARFLDDVERNHSLSSLLILKLPAKLSINKVYEVTSLSWHPLNKYLFAIGYGEIGAENTTKGIICLWNLKNPTFPERLYKFQCSVKCLAFSEVYPYIIIVGFCNGHAAIVNVLAKKLVKIFDTSDNLLTDNSPMTHLIWFKNEFGDYFPLTSHETGVIYRYNIRKDFIPELFLDLPRKFGPVKGIKQFSRFFRGNVDKMKIKIPISVFTQYSGNQTTYLVGTFDGYIHICSTIFKSKALDVFAAHEGPITSIEFHPVAFNLFLTTGCDYFIKIWNFGIFEPLISFSARKEFLRYAKWYGLNPMLVVGLSEMYIDVWDLRRINAVIPVSTYESPDRVSFLLFNTSPFGPHLLVGDANGQVNLFLFNEIDDEPKFKIDLLASALRNHIKIRDPLLWKKVEDLNPEFKINDINE